MKFWTWFLGLFSRARRLVWVPAQHPYRDPWETEIEQPVPEKWKFKMTWKYSFTDTLGAIVGVAAILFCSRILYGFVLESHTIDYCYVEYSSWREKASEREEDKAVMNSEGQVLRKSYTLRGHINWYNDRYLTSFPTLEETVKAAELLQCPVK